MDVLIENLLMYSTTHVTISTSYIPGYIEVSLSRLCSVHMIKTVVVAYVRQRSVVDRIWLRERTIITVEKSGRYTRCRRSTEGVHRYRQ